MPFARWLSLAVVAVCVAGCGARHVSAASARDLPGTFRSGGMDRTYALHIPPGYPVGLVLSLHGGGGTGIGQQGLTDFDTVADANNLLVAYPDGYDKSWADGRGASPALRPFSSLDHLLCERLDRCRPMELLCSRITEVDPARVEALHHFDIEPRPISWRTHRFQNVLPGSLR